MRQPQSGLVDDVAAVQDQVEVERPRRAGIWSFAPELPLDFEQRVEHGRGVSVVTPVTTALR